MNLTEKIRVENLYKIFGPKPEKARELLNKGLTKEEILEKTGMTIGVQDASFTVNEGEIFVVMGLSGSGKSTLVRMLNRLIEPTYGHVYVDGEDVASMSKDQLLNIRRKDLSMVFQSFALMPHMTVLENTAFGLELSGANRQNREEKAHKALEQVGLEAWAESMPDELSGGMKQRVGLARALAVNPSVMLMDEAFSALDPLIRAEMQDELLKIQSKSARTIIFISHDLDEAMRIGDRIAIMEGGRVVQVGTPEEILQNPADDYVKAFFRGVDPTNILSAGDIARKTQVTIIKNPGDGPRTSLQRLTSQDRDYGYVVNKDNKFAGVVSVERLQDLVDAEDKNIEKAFLEDATPVHSGDSLQDILPVVAANPWPVPVLNEAGEYIGVISKNTFLKTLHRPGEEL
jgi:glycine betaine/proline transport system ATP-binding protein